MNPEIEKTFDDTSHSKTFGNIVNIFELNKKSVLDLGCSYGEFLVNFGPGSTGVTISHEEVSYGKEKKGLDIRYGNVEASDFSLENKYDVIFANNLFEHLLSPHTFLCNMKRYLKPDGILILGVPCIPKITFLLNLGKFKGSLATAHINFFTRDTLIKTVERAGWNILFARGFHFSNKFMDSLLNLIYPHFYIVARMDSDFKYSEKRSKELAGYKNDHE